MPRTAAILPAAGSGKRMQGTVTDKVLAPLGGRPVFAHSAAAFMESAVADLYVVVYRDRRQTLELAVANIKPGRKWTDIARLMQYNVEKNGYSVVREFVGHGIGTRLHEEPQVPNFGNRGHGAKLREGMVIAIEPMVNSGKPETRVLGDKWTAVTADGSFSAHFEHCVAVTKDGPVILTQ